MARGLDARCRQHVAPAGVTDRDLYLFDTYTGMTPPTERDIRINEGKHVTELLGPTTRGPGAPMQWSRPENYLETLDDVQEGFASVAYPPERSIWSGARSKRQCPPPPRRDLSAATRHRLVRLDQARTDSPLSVAVAPGGVLILDDYGTWQGSREATDEFLAESGEPLLLTRVNRSRITVKPGLRSVV